MDDKIVDGILSRLDCIRQKTADLEARLKRKIAETAGNAKSSNAPAAAQPSPARVNDEKSINNYFWNVKQKYTNLWGINESIKVGCIEQEPCDAFFARQCEMLKQSDNDFVEKKGLLEVAVSKGYNIERLLKKYSQTPLLKSFSIASRV